jgi:hypothetical protein
VKVGIETNRKYVLEQIKAELPIVFPVEIKESDFEVANRHFSVKYLGKEKYKIKIPGEATYFVDHNNKYLPRFLSYFRVKIAEYAESRVFIHAGVVGWKGEAIVIPSETFKGKTTLVTELVKFGCSYYSDEYAVLDENGLVHPFPKMISLRKIEGDFTQTDISAEEFGTIGVEPIPVGLVLITEFDKNAEWQPEQLSVGQGMLEIISHTLPIRYKPEFTLFVLNKLLSRAIIAKSKRGEAPQFAKILTKYFEENSKLNFTQIKKRI